METAPLVGIIMGSQSDWDTMSHAYLMLEAVARAVALYRQPDSWRRLRAVAMSADFSWQGSAQRYLALYRKLRSEARRV